jgi:hypothetical protein
VEYAQASHFTPATGVQIPLGTPAIKTATYMKLQVAFLIACFSNAPRISPLQQPSATAFPGQWPPASVHFRTVHTVFPSSIPEQSIIERWARAQDFPFPADGKTGRQKACEGPEDSCNDVSEKRFEKEALRYWIAEGVSRKKENPDRQ